MAVSAPTAPVSVRLTDAPAASPAGPSLRDAALATALAACLFSIYLLTFAGVFRSIDELSFFATTENWVLARSLEPRLIAFSPYHNPIGPFEPGYALLAVPLYLAAAGVQPVSQAHAVMLLNPLLTAATAGVLFLLGRQLGYGRAAALLAAAFFGLGTMAWPYTRSFLREPAIGLLWTLSFWGLALCARRPGWRAAVLAVLPAVLGVGIKVTSGMALPVVVLAVGVAVYRAGRLPLPALLGLGLAGAAGAAALVAEGLSQRSISTEFLAQQWAANAFTEQGWRIWYGLLFSPGKSVFVYSPLLVLGVLAWPFFFRRHRLLATALALLTVAFLFSAWFTGWDAGVSWGPRYVLPLLPLWLLPTLALWPRQVWAWPVAALSVAFQALAASADWSKAYQRLFDRYPGLDPDLTVGLNWSLWRESPAALIVENWGRPSLDLVWLYSGLAQEIKLDWPLGLALAGAALLGALVVAAVWRWPRAAPAALATPLLATGAAVLLLGRAYHNLPDYPALTAPTARSLAAHLSSHPTAPAAIVNVSADFGTYQWLGLLKGPATRTWISPRAWEGYAALLPPAPGARLSVVMDRPHLVWQARPDDLLTWLNPRAFRLGSEWIEGYELVHYAVGLAPGPQQPARAAWSNGLALNTFAVPGHAAPGTALPIRLRFTLAQAGWSHYDRLFTNLVGANGRVLAGQENWLGHGNYGAAKLAAGDEVADQRALWIATDAPPGVYSLVVGFTQDGRFVPVQLADGTQADYIRLVSVIVEAARP